MKIFRIIFSIFTPLLYILVIPTISILFKLLNKKLIQHSFDKTTNTYWHDKDNKKSGVVDYFFKQS